MKDFIFYIVILFYFLSCSNVETKRKGIYIDEVELLSSADSQIKYLRELYLITVELKEYNSTIDSNDHSINTELKNQFSKNNKVKINLEKIENYLKVHGHPTKTTHGPQITKLPCLIILNSSSRNAPRRKNFKYIYRAYLKSDLDIEYLLQYLNRMYYTEHGKNIHWNKRSDDIVNINDLIIELGLEKISKLTLKHINK